MAALYNFAWREILLFWPDKVLLKAPPLSGIVALLVALVGTAFVACALKPRRWLIGLTLFAKALGPVQFVAAAALGYLAWSQWWMPIINDLIWLPPLIAIWRREMPS